MAPGLGQSTTIKPSGAPCLLMNTISQVAIFATAVDFARCSREFCSSRLDFLYFPIFSLPLLGKLSIF